MIVLYISDYNDFETVIFQMINEKQVPRAVFVWDDVNKSIEGFGLGGVEFDKFNSRSYRISSIDNSWRIRVEFFPGGLKFRDISEYPRNNDRKFVDMEEAYFLKHPLMKDKQNKIMQKNMEMTRELE